MMDVGTAASRARVAHDCMALQTLFRTEEARIAGLPPAVCKWYGVAYQIAYNVTRLSGTVYPVAGRLAPGGRPQIPTR